MDALKLEQPAENTFSHVKEGDTAFVSDGLRDFFLYRDLGIAKATGGKVIAQLLRANKPPEAGTGWHRGAADFHIMIMLKGWARFMYEDKLTLVEAGDCVHQRPGVVHVNERYNPNCEFWRPPFSPSATIMELSGLLREYRLSSVTGDRFAKGFVSELFRDNRVTYVESDETTSDNYLQFLTVINSQRCLLLDNKRLISQLAMLERRPSKTGARDLIPFPHQSDFRM